MNESDFGDREYFYVCNHLLFPIIKEFDPSLILISSGFDACKGDPIGKVSLS